MKNSEQIFAIGKGKSEMKDFKESEPELYSHIINSINLAIHECRLIVSEQLILAHPELIDERLANLIKEI